MATHIYHFAAAVCRFVHKFDRIIDDDKPNDIYVIREPRSPDAIPLLRHNRGTQQRKGVGRSARRTKKWFIDRYVFRPRS